MKKMIPISDGWEFRQSGSKEWLPAKVPGTVHTDLLRNNRIESPYFGLNERGLQWIDKVAWEYRTKFFLDEAHLSACRRQLIFEGLDTYAEVRLNGEKILCADNMFRRYAADIGAYLHVGENQLHVLFSSPTQSALKQQQRYGIRLPAVNDQSKTGGMGKDQVSPFIRKAPYHFGWDWGPRLVTSGVWRSVWLQLSDHAIIEDLFISPLKVTVEKAELEARVTITGIDSSGYTLEVIQVENGRVSASKHIDSVKTNLQVDLRFEVPEPKLWYPSGYGEQILTCFRAVLYRKNTIVDSKVVKIGLRSVALVREPDDMGKSFYFKVNGIPVFAKGANYIPNDIFLTEVDPAKYRHILQSAVRANMNMIRVWGGGVYEDDLFYDLCDQLGLMVWQDFMFACSMYPGTPEFIDSVRQEAIDNVKRLRNHPCIVLWCGNNEIDTAWSPNKRFGGWGWKQKYTSRQRKMIWDGYDTLFHYLLPEVVAQHDGGRAYWPSSPLADWGETAGYDNTSGDMHYWGVWHNDEPFENYGKIKARFMSEYGFQSFPQLSTVHKYTHAQDRSINSEVMRSHQRSGFGNSKILDYMRTYLPPARSFEEILYAGQYLQAYGIERAIELHRMRKPYTMGTLFWQLNDCWPVASWSSIDYYGNWKGVHYRSKNAFKPIKILASMGDRNSKEVNIWVTSDLLESLSCELHLRQIDYFGNELSNETIALVTDFEKTLHAYRFEMNAADKGVYQHSLLACRLMSDDQVIDEKIAWFDIPKRLNLPHADIEIKFTEENNEIFITIRSPVAVMGLALDFKDLEVALSDNYIDLLPGDTRRLKVSTPGLSIEELSCRLTWFSINSLNENPKPRFSPGFWAAAKRKILRARHLLQKL